MINEWSVSIVDQNGKIRPLQEINDEVVQRVLKLYYPCEAAHVLQIGRSTVYRVIHRRKIEDRMPWQSELRKEIRKERKRRRLRHNFRVALEALEAEVLLSGKS